MSSRMSSTGALKLKSIIGCHGISIYIILFPVLCAVATLAFVILLQMIQSQNRHHPPLKKQSDHIWTTKQSFSSFLFQSGTRSQNSDEIYENHNNITTINVEEEESLLQWLLGADGEEATRVNQTELLEAKKIFLRWAPKMKYVEGLKYLKNNPLLFKQFKEEVDMMAIQKTPSEKEATSKNESFISILEIDRLPIKEHGTLNENLQGKTVLKSRVPFKPRTALKHQKAIVPNIVHLIWFRPSDAHLCRFGFHHLISILSVHKFIKPDHIFMWHDNAPCGQWWREATDRIPNIVMKKIKAPTTVFGQPIRIIEHQTDVARINIILKYGGIYMDLDVVALKAWDPLLHYEATMGAETPNLLGSGVIVAVPNSKFIALWLESYKVFDDNKWNYNACEMPTRISRKYPELVHIEWETIHRPAWNEIEWLYGEGKLWDWSINYCVHLWYRYHGVEHSPEDIRKINTTMAEIFRYVYYETPYML